MAIIVLLLLLIVIIFSIPSVQTYVAKKVTNGINETYGTNINIDRLGLNWKGEIDIRGIYISDHHYDTLIFARQLRTNILSFKKLLNGKLEFGSVFLIDGKLYVKTYKDEVDDNLFIFSEKFNTDEPSASEPFLLLSDAISIEDTHVKIIDENLENPIILDLSGVNVIANDFKVTGPNVDVNIEHLILDGLRGYRVKDLQANFSYTLDSITLDNLKLLTEESVLQGRVVLAYSDGKMSDFENCVFITAEFKDSKIATNDLNTFFNEFGPNQLISLYGNINGILNDFTFTQVNLTTENTTIQGDFTFKNLLNSDTDYIIDAKNHTFRTNFYDLRRFMPRLLGDVLPEKMKVFGNFIYRGNSTLAGDVLTTNSAITSALGLAEINFEIGNIQSSENIYYRGDIQAVNLNLSELAGTISFGEITADLNIDGKGFTKESVSTEITGFISSFNFEGYNYQNINVHGNLKYPLFNGDFEIDDPNLKMIFNGLVDVSNDFNQYNFEATIDFAELNQLNLFKRDSISVFAGKVIMKMDGTNVDNAEGTISFKETFYQNEDDDFYFDDFTITSSKIDDIRTIAVNSPDILTGQISGKFILTEIPKLFRNGVQSIYANYIPVDVGANQFFEYDFEIYNKIIEVFVPQLKFGDNTKVKGFVSSDDSEFKLDFRSPEILVFNNYLDKVNIQIDNNNPLFNTYISIDSLYNGTYDMVDISLINKTIKDTLHIRSEFKGGKNQEDLFDLSFYHTIDSVGNSILGLNTSNISYKNKIWQINKNNNSHNKVTFSNDYSNIRIDSLVLSHQDELILMAGSVRGSRYKDIRLKFIDVNLASITPKIDSLRLEGNVNGDLRFFQKGIDYYANSGVTVDHVVVNGIEYGDLILQVRANEDLSNYSINASLVNKDVKSISATGAINVSGQDPMIDLDIGLVDLNMKAFSPLGADVISNIRGFISGNAKVTGSIYEPEINGKLVLNHTGMTIPYLNIDFEFEENTPVFLSKNKFDFLTTTITDTKYKTQGNLSGNITHNNFDHWELNLKLDTDRILVLDTPQDENALYYGTAFISGTAKINGPVDELVIDVNATTEEGTTFKIPLSDVESIGENYFINFLSPEEKAAKISGETLVVEEVKGLTLNFELDINENAEVEVVVDQENNSTLKGRGAGILLLEINTLGKFRMWGDFLIIEGVFDFRYGGVIEKNIEVVSGGNITWDGSPYRANLNLSAKYEVDANPAVLLDNPNFNRNIPVEVYVDLTGELIQPDLSFRLEFPRVSSIVKSELEYKLQNKEEMERQALFLFATGGFTDDNLKSSNTIGSSILEGQVNSLMAKLFLDSDSDFNILPYFESGSKTVDQETANEYGVKIVSQISDRVLINGKVGIPVGGVYQSNIAGDIEIQWLVNEDGSLRLTFFNRQAKIQFIGEDQTYEQGAGVSYYVDFDNFQELKDKLFNKKSTLDPVLMVTPDDNSFPVNFDNDTPKQDN